MMALVGGRRLDPVVGQPCRHCHYPTGDVDAAVCERCAAWLSAPAARCYALIATVTDEATAERLFPDGAPPKDAA